MRDAVVFSNWSFGANGTPERVARSLALYSRKVLYCCNPVSYFNGRISEKNSPDSRLYLHDTRFLGVRAGQIPILKLWQQHYLAHRISKAASQITRTKPIFFYHDVSRVPGLKLLELLKRRGWLLVHLNQDFTDPPSNARDSDITFSIPSEAFKKLRQLYGSKVMRLPQLGPVNFKDSPITARPMHHLVAHIPRPRILYLGAPSNRLNLPVIKEIFRRRSEWNFLFSGRFNGLDLPNCHALPWLSFGEMHGLLQEVDMGFLPYNCDDEMQFHCVPLKMFDYFLHGLPVVATPIRYTTELGNLIYTGDTAETMERAIEAALCEGTSSQVRDQRKALARQHNLHSIGEQMLNSIKELFPDVAI